jgi:hypothetical protein
MVPLAMKKTASFWINAASQTNDISSLTPFRRPSDRVE